MTELSQSNVDRNRASALDGLRGIAATAVVFYHAILHNDSTLEQRVLNAPIQSLEGVRDIATKLALSFLNGGLAVLVFFVLSGCVLRLSLEGRSQYSSLSTAMRFPVARLFRLYPPVFACMLFFYALSCLHIQGFPSFDFKQTISNAALYTVWPHGPSGTIRSEVFAIPFILVAWLLRRRLGLIPLALALGYSVLAIQSPPMVFKLPAMHGCLFAFMIGMLVAEPELKNVASKIQPGTLWLAALALISTRTLWPSGALTSLLASGIAAGVLVVGLLHSRSGSMAAILEHRWMQFLGKISFSLYLINVPVLYFIWAFTNRMEWPKTHALEAGLIIGTISLLLTIPLAWMSERWIEQPSIKLSRWTWKLGRTNTRLGLVPAQH